MTQDDNQLSNEPQNTQNQPGSSEVSRNDEIDKFLVQEKLDSEKLLKDKLQSYELKWFEGKNNERAAFWLWLFIQSITTETNMIQLCLKKTDDDTTFYEHWNLKKTTASSQERSNEIKLFFDKHQKTNGLMAARRDLEFARSIWAGQISVVKRIKWLDKKSEEMLEWAWDYLRKHSVLQNGVVHYFCPADLNEKYLAIIATIDFWAPSITPAVNIHIKNEVLSSMNKAFNAQKRRTSGKIHKINAEISSEARKKLNKMVEHKRITINKFIDTLIQDEYERTYPKKTPL